MKLFGQQRKILGKNVITFKPYKPPAAHIKISFEKKNPPACPYDHVVTKIQIMFKRFYRRGEVIFVS